MGFVGELLVLLQPLKLLLSRTIYFLLPPANHKTTIRPKEWGHWLEKGHQENSILPALSCLQTVDIHTVLPELLCSFLQSIYQLEGTPGKLGETGQIGTACVCLDYPTHSLSPRVPSACSARKLVQDPARTQSGIGFLSPGSKLNVSTTFSYQVGTPSPIYDMVTFWRIQGFL